MLKRRNTSLKVNTRVGRPYRPICASHRPVFFLVSSSHTIRGLYALHSSGSVLSGHVHDDLSLIPAFK